jgi:MSHA biogenesis protein MshM
MYLEHFGLKEFPFSLTPDTSFFMSRAGYQDALNVLLVALRSGEGFVKVTGEVGTGKTILCRTLLKRLGPDFVMAYVPNPYLKPMSLFLTIAEELGVYHPESIGQHGLLKRINEALMRFHARGKRCVVCLDEVQAMPLETLETLRLLTNLETEKSKLLQVVLFGQPELDRVLDEPSIRQLRQRITFSYELLPLNRVALEHYVRHRLAVADFKGDRLFHRAALDELHGASRGIPRLVNILANKAMIAAFGAGSMEVKRAHVVRAVQDTEDARRWARDDGDHRLQRWLYGSLGVVVVAGLVFIGFGLSDVFALMP